MNASVRRLDEAQLRSWIGREEQREQVVEPDGVRRLAALLDRAQAPGPGDPLPALWHWIFFAPTARTLDIAADGHPRRGGFLPDVPLPRRMWAGGRLRFLAPIRIGDALQRRSTIHDVRLKEGRSGALVFVTVRHELSVAGRPAIEEEQEIVYREAPRGDPAPPAGEPLEPQFSRTITPDPVLLFRYSAVTFNAHRIHYDRDYAVGVEGYPGLVVQAPLTATLLMETLHEALPETAAACRSLRFRALHPLFDGRAVTLNVHRQDERATLWAQRADDVTALRIELEEGQD